MTSLQPPSTKDDILQYLLKQGEASAQDLADHLTMSAQAIRRHLKDLSAEGLIEHRAVQEGIGRPNYLYSLSRKGRDRFPAQYDTFALSLLDTLAATVSQDQMQSILHQQWQRKAQDYCRQVGEGALADRVARLVALRQAEGYMAEWHPADADQGRPGFILTEYTCAIAQIAESFPSVCGHELEMFQLALPDCRVERTHWLVQGEHRCGYLIQAKG
jgi:DeoR family suf operon transcriptional repressor